jgi:di-heme oxidoreductase (putative peroxidase)
VFASSRPPSFTPSRLNWRHNNALPSKLAGPSTGSRQRSRSRSTSRLAFNPAPAMNDDGRDVGRLADFMTLLAPPESGVTTTDVVAGESVFFDIGCSACHLPTIQTGPNGIAALNRVAFHPYSDFLLHDMGSLGDGIAQGQASPREMRTAPLWVCDRPAGFCTTRARAPSTRQSCDTTARAAPPAIALRRSMRTAQPRCSRSCDRCDTPSAVGPSAESVPARDLPRNTRNHEIHEKFQRGFS